jgi:cytochrome c553
MAFEKGNTLGGRPKLFDAALRRAIAADDGKRIRDCAEQLLDLAAAGEQWAVRELIDRLDGKAVQIAEVSIADARVDELSDDQLLRLAAAGSDRTPEAPSSTKVPPSVH